MVAVEQDEVGCLLCGITQSDEMGMTHDPEAIDPPYSRGKAHELKPQGVPSSCLLVKQVAGDKEFHDPSCSGLGKPSTSERCPAPKGCLSWTRRHATRPARGRTVGGGAQLGCRRPYTPSNVSREYDDEPSFLQQIEHRVGRRPRYATGRFVTVADTGCVRHARNSRMSSVPNAELVLRPFSLAAEDPTHCIPPVRRLPLVRRDPVGIDSGHRFRDTGIHVCFEGTRVQHSGSGENTHCF